MVKKLFRLKKKSISYFSVLKRLKGYKYLDVLEKGDICQEKIKENIRKE